MGEHDLAQKMKMNRTFLKIKAQGISNKNVHKNNRKILSILFQEGRGGLNCASIDPALLRLMDELVGE